MKSKQESLFTKTRKNTKKWWIHEQKVYGGSLNYRKCSRPFDSKKLVHTVLKAKLGHAIWFTRSKYSIEKLIYKSAGRYGIKIKSFSIQKDHLHLLTWTSKTEGRKAKVLFQNFLRYLAAELGRQYKKIFKDLGVTKSQPLWNYRPFTRLVSWGTRSVEKVVNYIDQNTAEAMGFAEYKPRQHRLNKFLDDWAESFQFKSRNESS